MEIKYDNNSTNEINKIDNWQYVLAFFSLLSFLLSSVFLSVFLFISSSGDWIYAKHYSNSYIDFFISTLSYQSFIVFLIFWFFCTVFAIFSGIFKKSTIIQVSLNSFLVSILLSLLFFNFGLPSRIDTYFAENTFYQSFKIRQSSIWQNPDFGLLSGEIITINNTESFVLMGFDNKIWQVDCKDAFVSGVDLLRQQSKIKLIGRPREDLFVAREIIKY